MNLKLDRRFPSVADIEAVALRRLPRFIREYIYCGMGRGGAVRRNRDALAAVELLPRYAIEVGCVTTKCQLLGRCYAAPFGVAPVGFGGLAWPGAQEALALAARDNKIPFTAATFALSSLEKIRESAGEYGWFQLYRPDTPEVETDLLERAGSAGYDTLVVTVDVPYAMRRDHDIRNGFSLPPAFDFFTVLDVLRHPRWGAAYALETLRNGLPRFENTDRYAQPGSSPEDALTFIANMTVGHVTPEVVGNLRAQWQGSLVIKGVLSPDDALAYRDAGADALIVSNHGGRQLEAAPSSVKMLPALRAAVGADYPLIADGGVRTGLDICRMLALGADFVLLGRPFYYAIAAMGHAGAEHIMALLKAELDCTMGQLGCTEIADLRDRL